MAVALAGLLSSAGARSLTPLAAVGTYLDSADVVGAVEIVSIDDSATATDGPRILEAKVLAVAKGKVRAGQTLRIGEAAQLAGIYRPGERRLLLLKRLTSSEPYRHKAEWWNIPLGLEIMVEQSALDKFTFAVIRKWVSDLIAAERAVPAVEVRLSPRTDSTLELAITLANRGSDVIELNPPRVQASFDAIGRRYLPQIKWHAPGTDAWIRLKPGERLDGSISVEQILPALRLDASSVVALPDGTKLLPVMVGHLCIRFPLTRAWLGYTTVQVPLSP